MGYNIIDLLYKLIDIEKNAIEMYKRIAEFDNISPSLKISALILAKEEERHVESYSIMIDDFKSKQLDIIDFDVYDKISNLLFEYQGRIIVPKVEDVQSLLSFALRFEKQNIALLLDIQGRLVKEKGDSEKLCYKAIEEIIDDEYKHIENLKRFIK